MAACRGDDQAACLRVVAEVAQSSTSRSSDGGVTSLDDVLDFLAVGAVAVGVGTALFAEPALPLVSTS